MGSIFNAVVARGIFNEPPRKIVGHVIKYEWSHGAQAYGSSGLTHIVEGAFNKYFALVENDDAVTDLFGLIKFVGRQNDGDPLIGEATNNLANRCPTIDVNPTGRFVEKDNSGLRRKSQSEGQTLLFATREATPRGLLAIGESD